MINRKHYEKSEKGIGLRRTKAYVVIPVRKTLQAVGILIILTCVAAMGLSGTMTQHILISAKKTTLEKEKYSGISPLFAVGQKKEEKAPDSVRLLNILVNKKTENPASLLASEMILVSGVRAILASSYQYVNEGNFYFESLKNRNHNDQQMAKKQPHPALETTISSYQDSDAMTRMGIVVKNSTTYAPDYSRLFQEPLKLTAPEKGKPQVLIVHTHGTESYNPDTRSEDVANNMIRVGEEMEKVFLKNGVNVIHSHTMHDIPRYNNSYRKALDTIEETLKKYPSIQVVLDIHRDAMTNKDGEMLKVVADVKGEKVAQVMLVVGTNQMGLPNDHWQENLKFAMQCQKAINQAYPGLTRPIDLRQERFNMHATFGSLIIEVGTHGNTMEEALKSAAYTAEAISTVLDGLDGH